MFANRSPLLLILAAALATLALAAARPSSGAPAEIRHVVKAGETLWGIAEARYDGDPRSAVWRIQRRNGLADPTLVPGSVLFLPP